MITVLTGENDFEIDRHIQKLKDDFNDVAEKVEGSGLQPRDLPDMLFGATLFAENRLIIIKSLSDNKAVWADLADYLPTVPEETHLVLVVPKPDKRTKTYKALQKHSSIEEYKLWGEREVNTAERWTVQEAEQRDIMLGRGAAGLVVARSLVSAEKGAIIDQWRIVSILDKLAPLGKVGPAEVEEYIEETPVESVFGLLETALQGDGVRVKEMVGRLEPAEDPFRLFGLMSGQVFWLAALTVSQGSTQEVAKDFAAHPFVLGKLAPYARKIGAAGMRDVTFAFVEADAAMKTSTIDPWILIERALLKVVRLSGNKTSAV